MPPTQFGGHGYGPPNMMGGSQMHGGGYGGMGGGEVCSYSPTIISLARQLTLLPSQFFEGVSSTLSITPSSIFGGLGAAVWVAVSISTSDSFLSHPSLTDRAARPSTHESASGLRWGCQPSPPHS
jgi:hypothetical protein